MEKQQVCTASFNDVLYNKVIEIRKDLEKKEKVAPSLRALCEMNLDHLVLDCSMIEATISKLYKRVGKKYKPICQYLLRRWEEVNKSKQVGQPECVETKRKLKQQKRKIEKVKVDKNTTLYQIGKAVDKKLYLTNTRKENKNTSTLFGLCKAKIENNLKDFLLNKKTMQPLVKKISGDALRRCEKQVPEITEFSEVLWRLLIVRDFTALKLTNKTANNCPRELYFHLLKQRLEVIPLILSVRVPRLRPHWVLTDPSQGPFGELQNPNEMMNICFKALVMRVLLNIVEMC